MVHLAAVKLLYGSSPWLYAQIDPLYRASAYARYRNARIDRDVSKKLRERVEYERKIVNDYLNNDWTVRSGPFAHAKRASFCRQPSVSEDNRIS
jgi:hypothetical protein